MTAASVTKRWLAGSVLAAAAFCSVGCLDQAICEKSAECANDPPGEDYVAICSNQRQGRQAALRANSEEECHALADAIDAYDACRAQLDCNDFEENDLNGECDDEVDDLEDAIRDADDDGYGGRSIGRSGPGPSFDLVPADCSAWD